MSSIAEDLMLAVKARLSTPPLSANFRRAHRTSVTREKSPMVHLVDGPDRPSDRQQKNSNCRTARTKEFTVSFFCRDDEGAAAADDAVVDINSRLDPATAYPHGANLRQLEITPDEEIADKDAVRIDMRFAFDYFTNGWALDA